MSSYIQEAKRQEREAKLAGKGKMLFRNVSGSTVVLPKPSLDEPQKYEIPPGGVFYGDSYHQKALAETGTLRVIAVESYGDERDGVVEEQKNFPDGVKIKNVYDPATNTIKQVPLAPATPPSPGAEGAPVEAPAPEAAKSSGPVRTTSQDIKGKKI